MFLAKTCTVASYSEARACCMLEISVTQNSWQCLHAPRGYSRWLLWGDPTTTTILTHTIRSFLNDLMMTVPVLSVLQQILIINFYWILFQKVIYLWIGRNCNPTFLTQVLGVPNYAAVPDNLVRKDFVYLLGSHLLPIFPPTNSTVCLFSVMLHPLL